MRRLVLFIAAGTAVWPDVLQAEHPMEVQRQSARGEHLQAVLTYDRMPKRVATGEAMVAAGRSAWALSLPDQALHEFDRALTTGTLPVVEQARVHLSKGIIEFQEERYQVAILHAEKSVALLAQPGPLRGKGWFLWGEALARLGSWGQAEEKYLQAVAESSADELPELYYHLGRCQRHLGKLEAARLSFERVPLQHDRTPQAIRALAELALELKRPKSAAFWLARGRSEYPDGFLDSWVDYALVQAAAAEENPQELRRIRTEANTRYAPSDPWLVLLNAAAEEFEWNRIHQEHHARERN